MKAAVGACPLGQQPDLPESWYAVYTRSRSEKSVDLMLRRQRLETYLPLRRTLSRRCDRRVTLELPALPGYLFVRCFLWGEIRALIKKTPGVIRLVENGGSPCVIPEMQIDALRAVLESASNVDSHPYLSCGDRVEVIRGPFMGARGILKRFEPGRYRLVIAVEWVNRAVSVEIDPRDVERCP